MCTIRKLSGISLTKSGKTCISLKIRCQGAAGENFFQVSGIRASGIKQMVSGVRCQVSGIRYQVSGARCQVSGVRCQVSGATAHIVVVLDDLPI
jgi:hypothetical protein